MTNVEQWLREYEADCVTRGERWMQDEQRRIASLPVVAKRVHADFGRDFGLTEEQATMLLGDEPRGNLYLTEDQRNLLAATLLGDDEPDTPRYGDAWHAEMVAEATMSDDDPGLLPVVDAPGVYDYRPPTVRPEDDGKRIVRGIAT